MSVQTIVEFPDLQTEYSIQKRTFHEQKILYFCTRATHPKLQDSRSGYRQPLAGHNLSFPAPNPFRSHKATCKGSPTTRGMHTHLYTESLGK